MRFLSTLFTLGLLSGSISLTSAEVTCTLGRLFIGDKTEAKLHVLDLDDGKEVVQLNIGGADPSVYYTKSVDPMETGVIVTMFKGTESKDWNDGVSQFHNTGIILDDHGGHKDIEKDTPFVYDFSVSGTKAAHFVDHAGYVAIFNDGDWKAQQNASAYFIKHNQFGSNKSTPITYVGFNPAATGGPQHGVAYALSDERFVVSVAHPERAAWTLSTFNSPVGFGLYAKNATLLQNISRFDDANQNCIGYHGSGEYMNEAVHGCNFYTDGQGIAGTVPPTPEHAGVLTMVYHPNNDTLTSKKLPYGAQDRLRISTIRNQPGTNIMVGLYAQYNNFTLSTSFVTFTAGSNTLLGDAARVYPNPGQDHPCIFLFETSPNKRFLVYWPTGVLRVMIPSPWSIERNITGLPVSNAQYCPTLSFAASYDRFIIADSTNKKIHHVTVSTGNVMTTELTYTPGKIALALPETSDAICTPQAPGNTTPPPTGTGNTTPPPTGTPTGNTTSPPPTGTPRPPNNHATTITITTMSSIITLLVVNAVAFIMA